MSTDLWTLLLAGVVAAALVGGPGSGWAAQIHVGAAETSITPDRPVALEGQFRLRIPKGVDSPIMASVVVLESREGGKLLERSIMVSADLVHLPRRIPHDCPEQPAGPCPRCHESDSCPRFVRH